MIYNDEKNYYALVSTLTRSVLILNLFLPMMVDFLGEVIIALGYKYHQDTKFLYAHNQEDIEHSCIAIQSKNLFNNEVNSQG
jgi:hypothetical protein